VLSGILPLQLYVFVLIRRSRARSLTPRGDRFAFEIVKNCADSILSRHCLNHEAHSHFAGSAAEAIPSSRGPNARVVQVMTRSLPQMTNQRRKTELLHSVLGMGFTRYLSPDLLSSLIKRRQDEGANACRVPTCS
jgi:hypothetical protein